MAPPYIIDSSIWIHIWMHHPPDIFKSLWEQLRASVSAGNLLSPEEVLHELRRGTDDLPNVLAAEKNLFLPLDDLIQAAVTSVLGKCPDLANAESERNRADPFVVAVGMVKSGTVVTAERPRKAATARMKIPDACKALGVQCLDWFDFLRAIEWKL